VIQEQYKSEKDQLKYLVNQTIGSDLPYKKVLPLSFALIAE